MFYLHVCLCTHCGRQKRLRSSGAGITMWVLRTSPRSSGRRASVLDYWALSSPLILENRWTHLKLSKGHHPSAQLYLLKTEHHPIIRLCWYHRHHTPSQVHRCHFMNKETKDGAEYHLRLKGKQDPRVGLLVRILAQPHSVPGHWWSLGGWLKNEKVGGLESSIIPICALEPSKKGKPGEQKSSWPFRKCQPLEENLLLISNRYSSRLTWGERGEPQF